jgi:hypothetical protein
MSLIHARIAENLNRKAPVFLATRINSRGLAGWAATSVNGFGDASRARQAGKWCRDPPRIRCGQG